MLTTNLIRYACRAKAHVYANRSADDAVGNPVTIHEGAWAYCPGGARTEHEWESIDPVTLTDLKLVGVVRPREAAPEDARS